jgi:hypothetical protein
MIVEIPPANFGKLEKKELHESALVPVGVMVEPPPPYPPPPGLQPGRS